jgi:alkanesulfonate monooxygenase SsuD/methylene tetrahydromethanopterin reductase-like flavin-dependent oxidoreductase (luciferase family)
MLFPPGYSSVDSLMGVLAAKRSVTNQGGPQTIDPLIERGQFLCGSAETVVQMIKTYEAQAGFGTLLAGLQFATLPHDLTMKNAKLFAEQVMPHFREPVLRSALPTRHS